MSNYPTQITTQPNGTYTWSCSIDVDYYRRNMAMGFKACLWIAAFLLVFGAFLCYRFQDWSTLLIIAACDAVFLLISILIFWLFTHFATDPQEHYEMTDIYIKTGSGKSSVYFDLKRVKTATFGPKYIELKGKVAKMRVYAPAEDFNFVKSYIMTQLPGDCAILYE